MSDRPNVILVTFDSLSARDMSLYGYGRQTTPFLDDFATGSYVFDHMYANGNSTIPTLASILTGRYPLKQGSERARSLLAGKNRVDDLADALRGNGYRTAAVIGMQAGYLWIDSLAGAGRGWMSRMMAGRLGGRSVTGMTASLDGTFKRTLEILDAACRPFFLWLHIYPPHEPYLPSRRFRGTFVKERVFNASDSQKPYFNRFYSEAAQPAVDMLRGRYNEHILEIDHKFGGFLEALEKRDILETSMVVLTSDHAEMFERGYQGHMGPLLYNPLLHVPLIVRLPGGRRGGRVAATAEQVDIAPTVLDLLGCDIPRQMHGESLAGAMVGEGGGHGTVAGSADAHPSASGAARGSAKPKFSVSMAYRTAAGDPRGRSLAVTAKGHKLIMSVPSGACELYDLARDPGETTNLANHDPKTEQDLKEMILGRFATDDTIFRRLLVEAS